VTRRRGLRVHRGAQRADPEPLSPSPPRPRPRPRPDNHATDGSQGLAVVASFAGGPRNPAWYENLVANPDVEVQIQRRRFRAVATAVPQAERPAVWSQIVLRAPMYADYQKATEREIPVVILEPRA
jgi:deazaflavin-dependent oxidoreductase (nitroreductase family)